MSSKVEVSLKVNGEKHDLKIPLNKSLLGVLREDLKITSVKYGCGTGDCGNCTVLMDGKPVNSCMLLAVQAQNNDLFTIEGIMGTKLFNVLKEAFTDELSFQCGYCAPAIMLASYALLNENSNPSELDIRESISGILCRCTGYQKIIDGVIRASGKIQDGE